MDTEGGTWAVKQVDNPDDDVAELLEGAAFQEAALTAGIPTPSVRRTRAGEVIADCGGVFVRLHAWADLHDPDPNLDPVAIGQLVAGLHRVDFAGAIGLEPWYTDAVGAARWSELISVLRARRAPFADELDALLPELVALEAYVGGPPRELRTCHRDLWADNVRRTREGGLCVFDFDNAGLADPSQELAGILVEYCADPARAGLIRAAYVEAGGPGRVEDADGLRDGDRAAVAHPRRGLPALAGGHDRRRTGRQRGLGPRVRRPAADPDRDRGAPAVKRVRLELDRIRGAVGEIDPVFLDTPALACAPLGEALGCSVTLKVETINPVRSFKGRGTETVAAVAQRERATRMICASAGNLGQALAYSGARRDLEVTVVAARSANPLKLRQIAALGATVQLEGEDIEDARIFARELAQADGAYLVEDSLDLATCEGAATIGLELVRDVPKLDVVLVALGGGAMASGVAYVMRSLADHAEVIGIQPVGAPAMALSWRQGSVVETDRIDTIADGVAGRCPIPEVLDDLLVVLDDVLLVSEDSIKAGMRALYEHAGLVVEPSAALGIAAVVEHQERFAGRHVTTILCGSNVAPADFTHWVLTTPAPRPAAW